MSGISQPYAAAAKHDEEKDFAQRKDHAIRQLVSVYGFDRNVAVSAIDATESTDISTLYNYILDGNLGVDQGGPVTPVITCPHVKSSLAVNKKLSVPDDLFTECCEYIPSSNSSSKIGQVKNDMNGEAHVEHKNGGIDLKNSGDNDGNHNTMISGCESRHENWWCLTCGGVFCSRYVNGHGVQHYEITRHPLACSLVDLSVWCHACRDYIETGHFPILRSIVQELQNVKFGRPSASRRLDVENTDSNDNSSVPAQPLKRVRSASPIDQLHDAAATTTSDEEDVDIKQPAEAPRPLDESEKSDDSNADEANERQQQDRPMIEISLSDLENDDRLLEVLTAAAEAQGIPIDWLLSNLHSHDDEDVGDDDDEDSFVAYKFDHPPRSIQDVADFINSENCQRIIILAGAGISRNSGIPDFRSADGLYATLNADLLTADPMQRAAIREDPTLALDQTLFVQNQLPLLETKRDFILGTYERRWKATLAHRFIELLHTKTGKLVREYTQNIDGLEDQCQNLPQDKVIAVHGSMDRAECAICGESSDFGSFCEAVRDNIKDISGRDPKAPKNSTPIACRVCGAHALKPAIVLFRSSLPKIFFESVPSDVNDADLLLVMGTSLRVAPANSLVWRVPKNCMRVLVNKEPAGMQLGMCFENDDECTRDLFAEGDIDEVLLELMDCLGWIEHLEPLLASDSLPESSARLLREHLDRRQQTKELESMPGREAV